ncbi:Uncharacterized protein FKW44_013422, partial [Caligus rogercresseyi]
TGFGSISWLFIAEIIPPAIRSTAYSLCVAGNWMWNFAFSHSFLNLQHSLNNSGVFCLYASLSLVGFVFICLFLPETKDKSPEEIAEYFRSNKKLENSPKNELPPSSPDNHMV